ncbi:MAG: sulfotransferase family protein [Anaerolineae bacterium]|nr:sulfotransferase family protein [Anaerolineae bacterium]
MTPIQLAQWIEASRAEAQDLPGNALNAADTWISPTHKYFYLGTPKVACSKIKIVLQQLEGYPLPPDPLWVHFRDTPGLSFVPGISDFSTQEAVEILTSPEWFRFGFVRNPYSRLLSGYKSQVMDLASPYVGFRESIRKKAGYPTPPNSTPRMVGFRDFVRYISEQPDDDRDGHWKSQTSTLHMEAIQYDFVGRMESFAVDFTGVLMRFHAPADLIASVPKSVNTTQKLPLAIAYGKELADFVYGIFRDDFETFGYDRDSWMTDA